MGPTWPFLLIFESRVERHSFCGLRHSMATSIPRVDGLSTDPRVGVCDAPILGVSVDYPSTCGKFICLVSRDAYLSKNASWAHKSILIKTNITTILQLSPTNSIVDYTFI